MRKSRFSDEPIIGILKEQSGRCHGISDATVHTWRSRFGGKEVSDARRPKALDAKYRKLEKLPAETMRDAAALREALGTNF